MKVKILLIEDNDDFSNAVELALRNHQVTLVRAFTGGEGVKLFRQNPNSFATVVIDYCLPDIKGSEVAQIIRKTNPSQDFLFATGFTETENLLDLLETGGSRGFLNKGRPIEELKNRILESVSLYLHQNRLINYDVAEPEKIELEIRSESFVGKSLKTYEVIRTIRKFRQEKYSTLIIGETGTGKELVAQALCPKDKRIIVVDCPRYSKSENLLESDLFGHVKGAFTGADKESPGLLSQAQDQVVFFDELHQLSIEAQAKLLRFLQEMKYRKLGDHSGREISIRFKLIAAAKPEIFELKKQGKFLEDLLYRIGRLEIRVPSLRERPEDIEPLVRHFQDEFNHSRSKLEQKQFRISTVNEMMKYNWIGNVRELQNAVVQMMANAQSDIINPSDFVQYRDRGYDSANTPLSSGTATLFEVASQVEESQLKIALNKSKTKQETATRLGVTRWALNRLLTKYELRAEDFLLLN
jgi:DNA-binding NtrC family response regulator